jgi:hypothetical protein
MFYLFADGLFGDFGKPAVIAAFCLAVAAVALLILAKRIAAALAGKLYPGLKRQSLAEAEEETRSDREKLEAFVRGEGEKPPEATFDDKLLKFTLLFKWVAAALAIAAMVLALLS